MKRTRIRPRNPERAAKLRAEQFGDRSRDIAVASIPCACMGKHPACTGGWSEPSHVVSRGAGGKLEHVLPMSDGCHRAWHQHGRATWLRTVGWSDEQLEAELARAQAEIEHRLESEI